MTTSKRQFPEEKAFSDSLQALACAMQSSQRHCDAIRKDFLEQLNSFGKKFRRHLVETDAIAKTLPIHISFNDLAEKTYLSFAHAAEDVLQQERLHDEFKNQFIVFVYGKVKCGKSSLGNLVAEYASQPASFFLFADAQKEVRIDHLEEISEEGFEVKATEATTAIQGFRLPGLCWIDSPGLHSTTVANGELAQKYIAAADLVLFFANADSPARDSNLQEICTLLNKAGKAMIVVLTRSDYVEEDEINGELVKELKPTSPAGRLEQEKNMTDEIAKFNKGRGEIMSEIFSVSKKVADEAHRLHNAELWQGSNIGHLLQTLTNIMHQDAVRLKAQVPLDIMRNALDQIINGRNGHFSLRNLKDQLQKTKADLHKNHEDFNKAFVKMTRAMLLDGRDLATNIFHDDSVNKSAKAEALSRALNETLQRHCQNDLLPILKAAATTLQKELSLAIDQEKFAIEDNYQEFIISRSHANAGRGWGKTIGSGIGLFGFLVNPVVGIVAVTAGNWLGGKIGEAIGDDAGDSVTKRVKTGDNSLSQLAKLRDAVEHDLQCNLDALKKDADEKIYAGVERKIDRLLTEITLFEKNMANIINH